VAFLASCKRDIQKTDHESTIDFTQEPSDNPSDILETAFIKLETNDACLIDKTVVQVEFAAEKIFILTGGERKLLIFDRSGKFVAVTGGRGAGPGEYIAPMSFSIDLHRNIISVIDIAQRKLIAYDLTDYRFISEQKALYNNFSFEYLEDNKIVWKNTDYQSDYGDWSFLVTDREQNYVDKHLKKEFITGYFTGHIKSIYKQNGEVFAYTEYHPVIYHFMNDTVFPLYRLKFGKYQLPPIDYLKKISANNVNFLPELNRSDYVAQYSVFDAGKTFAVFYSVSEKPHIGIYNKDNRHTYNYTMEEFQDKLKIGKVDHISGTVDDYIVAVLQPFDLLEEKSKNYTFLPELQNMVAESSDGDNPVLFLFKVKKRK
jgi:hypothetical protein